MQFIPYFLGCAIGFVILENRPIKFAKVRMMIIIVVIKINFFLQTVARDSNLVIFNIIPGDHTVCIIHFCIE